MKKTMSLFLVFVVSAMLSACIVQEGEITSINPDEGTITLRAGESQTFTLGVTTNPPPDEITWELNGYPVEIDSNSTASSLRYTFYANNDNINDLEDGSDITPHVLTASESGGDTITWEIIVQPNFFTSEISRSQAEEALYTVYAGIGHMPSSDNDEFLYGVMLKDLNVVTGYIAQLLIVDYMYAVLYNLDIPAILRLLLTTQTHSITLDGNRFTVSMKAKGTIGTSNFGFDASLYADLGNTGMTYGNCVYTGTPGVNDLFAQVDVGLIVKLAALELEAFTLNSLSINARDTLVALYPSSTVTYDNWNISYGVTYGSNPVNAKLLPFMFASPNVTVDSRDYTLRGSFSVDGNLYSLLGSGLRYRQVDNGDGTASITISSGELYIPGIEKRIRIAQTSDIVRDALYGLWTSGGITISGYLPSVDVVFAPSNTASFELYMEEVIADSWDVMDWQDTLGL